MLATNERNAAHREGWLAPEPTQPSCRKTFRGVQAGAMA